MSAIYKGAKISWPMVSNAEERSNRTSIITLPLSSSLGISFLTLSRAVSVLWRDLYADWNVSPSPFIWKCCLNLDTAGCSRILPRMRRLDTGQYVLEEIRIQCRLLYQMCCDSLTKNRQTYDPSNLEAIDWHGWPMHYSLVRDSSNKIWWP